MMRMSRGVKAALEGSTEKIAAMLIAKEEREAKQRALAKVCSPIIDLLALSSLKFDCGHAHALRDSGTKTVKQASM